MPIDMASVYADRFKANPQILQAAVLGQAPIPGLDPYTALRSLQLIKESQRMQMAQAAQQPTQAPSLVDQAVAQPVPEMFGAVPEAAPESEGLAGMSAGQQNYAPGGIVSFAERGMVEDEDAEDDAKDTSPGFPLQHAQAQAGFNTIMQRILSDPQVRRMTPTQRKQFIADYIREQQEVGGENPYAAMRKDITEARGESARNLDRGLGIALLRASRAALEPGGTARGLAAAASEFGGAYGQVLQADRAEKRALANMQFQLADAERKERMGLHREARMSADAADKSAADAARDARTRDIAAGNVYANVLRATRPGSGAGAGKAPSLPQVDRQLGQLRLQIIDMESKNPNDPKLPVLKQQASALMEVLAASKDYGPGRLGVAQDVIQQRIDANLGKAMRAFDEDPSVAGDQGIVYARLLRDARAAGRKGDKDTEKRLRDQAAPIRAAFEAEQRRIEEASIRSEGATPGGAPAAAPAAAAKPASGPTVRNW
jgi:hypothetical protein